MASSSLFRRIDWSHLSLVSFLAAVVVWYLLDSIHASRRIENLLFVVPAAVVALALCAWLYVQIVRTALSAEESRATPGEAAAPLAVRLRPVLLLLAFAAYAAAIGLTGFDVSTFVFLLVALLIQGERGWILLAIYPAAFTAVVCYGFRSMLPYSMPMLLL
jgi:hypothetical protein